MTVRQPCAYVPARAGDEVEFRHLSGDLGDLLSCVVSPHQFFLHSGRFEALRHFGPASIAFIILRGINGYRLESPCRRSRL